MQHQSFIKHQPSSRVDRQDKLVKPDSIKQDTLVKPGSIKHQPPSSVDKQDKPVKQPAASSVDKQDKPVKQR